MESGRRAQPAGPTRFYSSATAECSLPRVHYQLIVDVGHVTGT
jgi:hypothetical protein